MHQVVCNMCFSEVVRFDDLNYIFYNVQDQRNFQVQGAKNSNQQEIPPHFIANPSCARFSRQ